MAKHLADLVPLEAAARAINDDSIPWVSRSFDLIAAARALPPKKEG